MGGDREGWNDESFGWGPRTGKLPPPPCSCSVHSAEGLEAGSHVAMGLSFPYRYFKSNHWFHISEYYVRWVSGEGGRGGGGKGRT